MSAEALTLWADAFDHNGALGNPAELVYDMLPADTPKRMQLHEAAALLGRLISSCERASLQSDLDITDSELCQSNLGSIRAGLYVGRITTAAQRTGNVIIVNQGYRSTLDMPGVQPPDRGVTFHHDDKVNFRPPAGLLANAAAAKVAAAPGNRMKTNSAAEYAERQRKMDSARAKSMASGIRPIDLLTPEIRRSRQELATTHKYFRDSPPVSYRPQNAIARLLSANCQIRRVVDTSSLQRGLKPEAISMMQRGLAVRLYGGGDLRKNWRDILKMTTDYYGAQLGRLDEMRRSYEDVYDQNRHNIRPEELDKYDCSVFGLPAPLPGQDYSAFAAA